MKYSAEPGCAIILSTLLFYHSELELDVFDGMAAFFFSCCFVCAAKSIHLSFSLLTGFVCFRKTASVTGSLEPEKSLCSGAARSVRGPARQALQRRLMV